MSEYLRSATDPFQNIDPSYPLRHLFTPETSTTTGLQSFQSLNTLDRAALTIRNLVTARGLSLPLLLVCLTGTRWTSWRRPHHVAILLLLAASYYVFLLRAAAVPTTIECRVF